MNLRIFHVTLNAVCSNKKQKHNVRSNTIVNSSFIPEMGTRCSFNNLRCVSEEFVYRKWYVNDLFFLCCFTCTLNINKREWTKLSEILNLIKIFTTHYPLFLYVYIFKIIHISHYTTNVYLSLVCYPYIFIYFSHYEYFHWIIPTA